MIIVFNLIIINLHLFCFVSGTGIYIIHCTSKNSEITGQKITRKALSCKRRHSLLNWDRIHSTNCFKRYDWLSVYWLKTTCNLFSIVFTTSVKHFCWFSVSFVFIRICVLYFYSCLRPRDVSVFMLIFYDYFT